MTEEQIQFAYKRRQEGELIKTLLQTSTSQNARYSVILESMKC